MNRNLFSATYRSKSTRFDVEKDQGLYDPEHPEIKIDPGPSPSTTGDLRIDFVPTFDFWVNKVSSETEIIYGNAQSFHGPTPPRGNYIQITDERDEKSGWLLQMRQEYQFQSEEEKELRGAALQLDDSWVNSTKDLKYGPKVSKDVVRVRNIGETYNLAEAKKGTGHGTWEIVFGSSDSNKVNEKNTLEPRTDHNGKIILSDIYDRKPIYLNKALQLVLPGLTQKEKEVPYQID
ncbi:WxL domain-containing protein [Enterococcus rivorum]|uniref:WxL domain-containing protein n=1 Tax=Enterococcus rivorum TaxID=762845 RepID=UPI0024811933|nr:WxL domain-containing protein [Enterococcus rivorum]